MVGVSMIRDKEQRQKAQEALAVLHRLYGTSIDALIQYAPTRVFLESQAFRSEATYALFTVADIVYGKPAPNQSSCLCDACHMARALDGLRDPRTIPLFLCPACYQHYQAQTQVGDGERETAPPVMSQEG